jgi:hypothetical protein
MDGRGEADSGTPTVLRPILGGIVRSTCARWFHKRSSRVASCQRLGFKLDGGIPAGGRWRRVEPRWLTYLDCKEHSKSCRTTYLPLDDHGKAMGDEGGEARRSFPTTLMRRSLSIPLLLSLHWGPKALPTIGGSSECWRRPTLAIDCGLGRAKIYSLDPMTQIPR